MNKTMKSDLLQIEKQDKKVACFWVHAIRALNNPGFFECFVGAVFVDSLDRFC